MKIAIAQIKSLKGNWEYNIALHEKWIAQAIAQQARLIFFPELSLTGYEPTLAKTFATTPDEERLKIFQTISDTQQIAIALGLPTPSSTGPQISMALFQAHQKPLVYTKQWLHADELPYFAAGTKALVFEIENTLVAPAICYESLEPQHVQTAHRLGAEVYLASVAKAPQGVEKAFEYYPQIAAQYGLPVLMANGVGPCDSFVSAGQSAVWNEKGELLLQLDQTSEGLLIFDTHTEEVYALNYSQA